MRPHIAPVAIVCALTAAETARAQNYNDDPDPTDHPQYPRAIEIVDAFNDGSVEVVGNVVKRHFSGSFADVPAEEHASAWRGIREKWGPVEFAGIRSYSPPRPEQVTVILRAEATENWRAFAFELDENGFFTSLYPATARRPTFLPPAEPLEPAVAAARLDGFIDRMTENDLFSGTIVITQNGETLLSKASGLASRRFEVPHKIDTKLNMGSMGKMFTALSIGQLMEDGKLTLDDTVGDHLPELLTQEIRDNVRIKHLLSHTGGTGNHFTTEYFETARFMRRSPDDYFDLFGEEELAFEPGTDWAYSNGGYYILGAIIEAVSGEGYFDYIRRHILEPAGMTDTDNYDMDLPVKNLAIGYTRSRLLIDDEDDGSRWFDDTDGFVNNNYHHMIKGGPPGGGYSTSPDMQRFAKALAEGRIVSSETLDLFSVAKPELGSSNYGYGFQLQHHPVLGAGYGHTGGFPGVNACCWIFPESGIVVTAMCNLDTGAGDAARRFFTLVESGS